MAPCLSPNDAADVGLRCAKAHRQINLARAFGVEVSDHRNLILGEAGMMMAAPKYRTNVSALAAEYVEAVPNVIGESNDFQVLNPVVVLNAVDVIDLHTFGDRANEGGSNEAVNLDVGLSLPSSVQANATVAVLVSVAGEFRSARTRDATVSRNAVAGPPLNISPLSHPLTPTVYSVGGISLE